MLGLPSTEPKTTNSVKDEQARLLSYVSTGGILDYDWNGPIIPFITDWKYKVDQYSAKTNEKPSDSVLLSFLEAFVSRHPELCHIRDWGEQETLAPWFDISFEEYYQRILRHAEQLNLLMTKGKVVLNTILKDPRYLKNRRDMLFSYISSPSVLSSDWEDTLTDLIEDWGEKAMKYMTTCTEGGTPSNNELVAYLENFVSGHPDLHHVRAHLETFHQDKRHTISYNEYFDHILTRAKAIDRENDKHSKDMEPLEPDTNQTERTLNMDTDQPKASDSLQTRRNTEYSIKWLEFTTYECEQGDIGEPPTTLNGNENSPAIQLVTMVRAPYGLPYSPPDIYGPEFDDDSDDEIPPLFHPFQDDDSDDNTPGLMQ